MEVTNDTLALGRARLLQVFRYIEALNDLRNPSVTRLDEHSPQWTLWLDKLPAHPDVSLNVTIDEHPLRELGSDVAETENWIMRVRRPKLTAPPQPPTSVVDWLEPGWKSPNNPATVIREKEEITSEGLTEGRAFTDDPIRVADFENWRQERDKWADNERPAVAASKLFERLYTLHGTVQREAEHVELVIGDGILKWNHPDGAIHHPVILKRVRLEFHPDVPEFAIYDTDRDAEFYTSLFNTISDVDSRAIACCRHDFEMGNYHPLMDEDICLFLQGLVVRLSPKGEFDESDEPSQTSDVPIITRSPVIFLRKRTTGFAKAIESTIEDIETAEQLSEALLQIVGVDVDNSAATGRKTCYDEAIELEDKWELPQDILLGKPANAEQIRIARSLQSHVGVLVQGPPGTGKTHTIANLIGHLLAEGKSVLVTSHTTKALRVLREHVVEELRPLCVSVLESDANARKQLQDSVDGIVNRLSSFDRTEAGHQAQQLTLRRRQLIERLAQARHQLYEARQSEYRDIVVAGKTFSPSDAARIVHQMEDTDDWIPTPVRLGNPLPLSREEIVELYRTNGDVDPDDEVELESGLPDVHELLSPIKYRDILNQLTVLSKDAEASRASQYWVPFVGDEYSTQARALDRLEQRIESEISRIDLSSEFRVSSMEAGREGGLLLEPWERLVNTAGKAKKCYLLAQEARHRYSPVLPGDITHEEQIAIIDGILKALEGKGRILGRLSLQRPDRKRLVQASSVCGRTPATVEEFRALMLEAQCQCVCFELRQRWHACIESNGGPSIDSLGEPIELSAQNFCHTEIQRYLDWNESVWEPIESQLRSLGFEMDLFLTEQPTFLGPRAATMRFWRAIAGPLLDELRSRAGLFRYMQLKQDLQVLMSQIEVMCSHYSSETLSNLRNALLCLNADEYRTHYERLEKLQGLQAVVERRKTLLDKLRVGAPEWARRVDRRQGIHGMDTMPGNVADAWLWRQLSDELDRRHQVSLESLQSEIEELSRRLRATTVELIECRAWSRQTSRVTLETRQALVSYVQLLRALGRGRGKRAPQLRKQAREAMIACRKAVPVWIMPLTEVAETFDSRTTEFDVVIIDEASQCDLLGMIALYMGRKVIIVGDDEQVSPMAVGQDQIQVQRLIDEHLDGIPYSARYDGRASIYDLAKSSFGEAICLLEHFRCVPDIIGFSNHISYNGRIRPLRDSSKVALRPYVVSHRVAGGFSENRINRPEALEVASLLLACSEQFECQNKTFGVISLVGEEQALLIDRLIRSRMSEPDYHHFRVLCGNPAHFQGDERDVVFISMVDGPADGPLRLRLAGYQDMNKKRFNVAASRARDQMWVVHSLDPDIDLKRGDLRRTLLEYARNPEEFQQYYEQKETKTESVFEREVMRRLEAAGYRVDPQWKVGAYRIDLVVEGADKRLAIECDGDRYHTLDNLADDNARQAQLERMGWTFARIRGSQFFRDPDKAMEPVFRRLHELGIPPEASLEGVNENACTVDSELKQRVIQQAAEIRKDLGGDDTDIDLGQESSVSIQSQTKILRTEDDSNDQKDSTLCSQDQRDTRSRLDAGRVNTSQQQPQLDLQMKDVVAPTEARVQPSMDDEERIRWVSTVDSGVWFSIANWAKRKQLLSPWERRLLFSIGAMVIRGSQPSIEQAVHANRLYKEAHRLGFDMKQEAEPVTTLVPVNNPEDSSLLQETGTVGERSGSDSDASAKEFNIAEMVLEVLKQSERPLRAREIAAQIKRQFGVAVEKKAVNRCLYLNLKGKVVVDENYKWSLPNQ